ncbi:uncharacterized protein BKA78DRAFT_368302 [Phyllosticta capitalensis]|uniref:C3H1-type domain-containing protein n=1 Tax=Phyllosticta capitalensis TaxID=121624 RepID=A0ABR1YVN9_9PEZI
MSHPQGNWPPFGQPLYITQGDGQAQPAYAQQTQGAPQPYGTPAPTQPQPPTGTWQQGAYPTFAQQIQQLAQPAQPAQQTYTVVYQGAPPAFQSQQPMYLPAPSQPQHILTPPAATPQQPTTTAAPFQPQHIFTPPAPSPRQSTTPAAPFQPQHPATDAAASSDQLKMTRQQWQELLRAEHAEAQAQKAPSPVLTGLQQSSFAEPSASPAPEPRQQLPTRRLVESRADISGLRKLLNRLTVDGGEQSEPAPEQDDEQSEPELQSSDAESEHASPCRELLLDQGNGQPQEHLREMPSGAFITQEDYDQMVDEIEWRLQQQHHERLLGGPKITDPMLPNLWKHCYYKKIAKCCFWYNCRPLQCVVPNCPYLHDVTQARIDEFRDSNPEWVKDMRRNRQKRERLQQRRQRATEN